MLGPSAGPPIARRRVEDWVLPAKNPLAHAGACAAPRRLRVCADHARLLRHALWLHSGRQLSVSLAPGSVALMAGR